MKNVNTVFAIITLWICTMVTVANAVVINFDDRPGMLPPYSEGRAVEPQYLVNDEYLSLGVLFDSPGGGIFIAQSSNPVSAPNTANPTGPGSVINWNAPVDASFWSGNTAAVVDYVSITLTNSSSSSRLTAYAYNGDILGSVTGGASTTLQVNFTGQIHKIIIDQGRMAFDDFTFDGLTPIPEPASAMLMMLGAVWIAAKRKR